VRSAGCKALIALALVGRLRKKDKDDSGVLKIGVEGLKPTSGKELEIVRMKQSFH